MFRKMLLAAVLSTFAVSAVASAQEPKAWKLGVDLTKKSDSTQGLEITRLYAGSPAERMGLEVGDLLITVNGELSTDPFAVRDTVFASDSVQLLLRRSGEYYRKDVVFDTTVPVMEKVIKSVKTTNVTPTIKKKKK